MSVVKKAPPNALRRYRQAASLTLEQVAEKAGLSVSQVSRIERGEREPSLSNLHAFARILKLPIAALVASVPVFVVGQVEAGAGVVRYGADHGPLDEAERPPEATEHTVALVVKGEALAGTVDDGWLIYFNDVRAAPSDDMLGQLCVIGMADGRTLVKRLNQGRERGRFDLYANNSKPLLDQEVAWAGKVTWIKPR